MVPLFSDQCDLSGFTLILPTISVGNVPQLTVDLLISSCNLKKSATIWHPAIVSSVGPDPYEDNGPEVCTACELYTNERYKLALVQLRSTLTPKLATKFLQDFKRELSKQNLKEIIILTSSFDHELHVINQYKFYYIANNPGVVEIMNPLNVKPKEADFDGRFTVYGSGFAVKLFDTFKDDVQCTLLIKYVSEGDNRPDAIGTVAILTKLVQTLKESNLSSVKFPPSWNCVFGGPPPIGIY